MDVHKLPSDHRSSVTRDQVLLLINEATKPMYATLYRVEGGITILKIAGAGVGVMLALLQIMALMKR